MGPREEAVADPITTALPWLRMWFLGWWEEPEQRFCFVDVSLPIETPFNIIYCFYCNCMLPFCVDYSWCIWHAFLVVLLISYNGGFEFECYLSWAKAPVFGTEVWSDLTGPGPPQQVAKEGKSGCIFQGNLGWWNMISWPETSRNDQKTQWSLVRSKFASVELSWSWGSLHLDGFVD